MKKSLAFLAGLLAFSTQAALVTGSDLPPCCRKELANELPLPDTSIYQVSSIWTNDAARAVELVSLQGKPVVLAMFFASCEFACPLLVNDMKRIEAGLPETIRTNCTFVLVSFDSERDRPAALARYRSRHGLGGNWTLLTGKPDDVQELAALLGVKYKKDARGQFAHSNLITLLDSTGTVSVQQTGLNQPGTAIVSLLSRGNR